MVYVLVAAVFVFLYGAKFSKPGEFNRDYMSKETTGSINGIFVVVVFMSHISQYMSLNGPTDRAWTDLKGYLGQLVVVTFLFYSGYGMMCSVFKKGTPYIKGLFKNRFLSLLLHFDIAILLYALVNLAIGREYTFKDFLIALTTWKGIGNETWYITAILSLYILMIISFLIFRKSKVLALCSMTALTVLLTFVFIKLGRPTYCYNTLILFPLGMWYAYFKNAIDKFVAKNNIMYFLVLCIVLGMYVTGQKYKALGLPIYWVWACAFMILIVLVSMKLKIGNTILESLGKHVFSIYILQRIPMSVFNRLGFANNNLNFFCMCFITTVFLSILFDKAMAKLDSVVFKPKEIKIEIKKKDITQNVSV
ncbi:MAG: acyltransferase family protein [Clostridia bacterium]|nr:acyltransferase family protein [Clostridia bacterium]